MATDKTFNIFNIFFGNFNGLKKIEFTFLVNQVRFTFNVRQIVSIMANKFHPLQSAIHRPQRNTIFSIRKDASIISNCAKYAKFSFNFPVKFVSISNFRDATHYHLSRKIKTILYSVIGFVMEFILVVNFLGKSGIRNFIAGGIRFLQSIFERSTLFLCRQKFYLQRQFHNAKIRNNFIYLTNYLLTKGERQFLPPTLRDEWVSLPKYL